MIVESVTPILNVSSVPESFAWFENLGWKRSFSWNEAGSIDDAADRNDHGEANFGGVRSGDANVFFCKDGQGEGAVWMSWWFATPAEVDQLHERALELHYAVVAAPRDEPWGVRECVLRHPDGHTFRVSAGTG